MEQTTIPQCSYKGHDFCLSVDGEVIAEGEEITLRCNYTGCNEKKTFKINSIYLEDDRRLQHPKMLSFIKEGVFYVGKSITKVTKECSDCKNRFKVRYELVENGMRLRLCKGCFTKRYEE